MRQSRWKSKVAWLTLLPIITVVGDTYNLWDILHMPKDNFTQLFMGAVGLLTFLGVFNNPTNNDKF